MADEQKPPPPPEKPAAPAAAAPKAAAPAAKPAAGDAAAKAPAAKAAPAHEPAKAAPPAGPIDPPPPADAVLPAYITALQAAVPGAVEHVSYYLGDWTIIVAASQLINAATHLRDSPEGSFDYCSDVTAVDWPPRAQRFDVVYSLYSIRHRHRVRVKVRLAENQPLASVSGLWSAANWLEREVYDMFGVNFTGHP